MNQSIDPAVLSLRDEGAAHPHAMDAYWMPFTANRQFKKSPRLLAFLADLRTCCFDGELNRTYGASTAPLTAGDLSTLQQAYTRLVAHLVDPR